MQRRLLSILLVMAMGISLLAGCSTSNDRNQGGSETTENKTASENLNGNDTAPGTDAGAEQDSTETTGSQAGDETIAMAVIADGFGEKKVEITYNLQYSALDGGDDYFLNLYTLEDDETPWYVYSIEFWADYTAEQYYSEQVNAYASMGLEASTLENYVNEAKVYGFEFVDTASGEEYSSQLLVEIEGGLLIVHNPDLGVDYEEDYAKTFAEKVFVSATVVVAEDSTAADDADAGMKVALTNEDKENVYKADYEAIKDQIAEEVKDGNEVSYLDANGNEIMFVYYDGENIEDVFFYRYNDNGVQVSSRVYAFDENGEYGIMEFEYHENGNKKSEIVYNENGGKMVISFDESGDYVSMTEYDKDGNVIE